MKKEQKWTFEDFHAKPNQLHPKIREKAPTGQRPDAEPDKPKGIEDAHIATPVCIFA